MAFLRQCLRAKSKFSSAASYFLDVFNPSINRFPFHPGCIHYTLRLVYLFEAKGSLDFTSGEVREKGRGTEVVISENSDVCNSNENDPR